MVSQLFVVVVATQLDSAQLDVVLFKLCECLHVSVIRTRLVDNFVVSCIKVRCSILCLKCIF